MAQRMHGGETMTTNQTIDGMPRKLAERFAQYAESGKVAEPSMVEELRALLDAPAENVIDVSATDWAAIQEAASESTWMPNEYMRNDWIADVCNFLKYGRAGSGGAAGAPATGSQVS